MELVKNENPEIQGKKIYYCVAGKLELAIPSVNIIKKENGIISADTVYVINIQQGKFAVNTIEIGLAPIANVEIQYNLLREMNENDPIYNMVVESMSGITRPHWCRAGFLCVGSFKGSGFWFRFGGFIMSEDAPVFSDKDPDFLTVTCPSCGFLFNVPYHLVVFYAFECPECKTELEIEQ